MEEIQRLSGCRAVEKAPAPAPSRPSPFPPSLTLCSPVSSSNHLSQYTLPSPDISADPPDPYPPPRLRRYKSPNHPTAARSTGTSRPPASLLVCAHT